MEAIGGISTYRPMQQVSTSSVLQLLRSRFSRLLSPVTVGNLPRADCDDEEQALVIDLIGQIAQLEADAQGSAFESIDARDIEEQAQFLAPAIRRSFADVTAT